MGDYFLTFVTAILGSIVWLSDNAHFLFIGIFPLTSFFSSHEAELNLIWKKRREQVLAQ